MVMRNRYDGAGSPGGPDDLPLRLRERLRPRFTADLVAERQPATAVVPQLRPAGPNVVRELARFCLIFVGIAVANVLFLLLALCYLHPLGR
jgi:hypothetical protein